MATTSGAALAAITVCVLGALSGCGRQGSGEGAAVDAEAALDAPPSMLRDCVLRLQMDEPAWFGAPGEVIDSCGGDDNGTAKNGISTVTGGVHGRSGSSTGSLPRRLRRSRRSDHRSASAACRCPDRRRASSVSSTEVVIWKRALGAD